MQAKKKNDMQYKIKRLDFKNSKELWSTVKKCFNVGKSQSQRTASVEIEKLHIHFKNLNETSAAQIPKTILSKGPLDFNIYVEEVTTAIKNLKCRKAPGHDNILNELLKYGSNTLAPFITKLFNIILESGKYPQEWNIGFIVPIFKKGDRADPNNYRGITLLSCLSKLFTSILNTRLYEFLIENEHIKKEQGGFRKKHSTIDSIYTLKNIIDKVVKCKPKKTKSTIYMLC